MNTNPFMSKRAIRITTALALLAVMFMIAISLLMTGTGGATAFNAGISDSTTRHMPIPSQYTAQCSNGVAVPNPASNAGLVADCAALLASKDTLEGTTGNLNWSANLAISDWGYTDTEVDVENDRVTYLRLDDYGLNGAIPAELGKLSNLRQLRLKRNQLTGAIPAELGDLANLRDLTLSDNQLTGVIPAELGNLANLTSLWLRQNRLSGEIPAELSNLTNLSSLHLEDNQLTGVIPAELGNLANLTILALGDNDLSGEIPTELGNLSNLTDLYLNSNDLTGEIPAELGKLSNLWWLYLYRNRLTGEIPAELGKLSNLLRLYLSNNDLTGEIPAELGNLSNLQQLTLRNNQLTGCIPQSLSAPLAYEIREGLIELPICAVATATPTPTATSAPRATATPTATPTRVPGTTPVATPTPTATSVASNEVMNRLTALERQVAEIPDLKNQIAVLATKVAQIEGGSSQGATTATPTPTATPASIIEASPTPTPTPSPTPTSVAGTSAATCIERLAGNGSVNGTWTPACLTANSPDNRTYYARFYTFTLYVASEVTITLSSADATPYLFLLEGEGTGGEVTRENGVANANSVTITAALHPGAYTIEASTYSAETAGDFTLEMQVAR